MGLGNESSTQNAWIWGNISEEEFPWGEIIDKKCSIPTSKVMSGQRVDESNSLIVVSLTDTSLADIKDQACLPTIFCAPLVNRKVRTAIQELVPAEDVQFVQTRVICQDGETIEYRYVAIQILAPCINVRESEGLNWVVPDKMIIGAKRLSFLEGCLGKNDIVRDEIYNPLVIISERMRRLLANTGVPVSAFWRIEDMEDIGFPA